MILRIRKILCWFNIHPYNPKYLKRYHWDAGDWKGKNVETCKLCGARRVWYDK